MLVLVVLENVSEHETLLFCNNVSVIVLLLMQMPTIKLQSSDGEMFEVDVEIAKQSVTIKTMLEGKMI